MVSLSQGSHPTVPSTNLDMPGAEELNLTPARPIRTGIQVVPVEPLLGARTWAGLWEF